MNNVTISGRIANEVSIKELGDKKKLSIRLAVSRNDKNKTADFFNCQAWNNTAEFINKYFHKGDPIEIIGRLRTDNYEKQDGSKVYETYILVSEAGFALSKGKTEEPRAESAGNTAPDTGSLPFEI